MKERSTEMLKGPYEEILEDALEIIDKGLAVSNIPIPHRPIEAAMAFVSHCVKGINDQPVDEFYLDKDWFKKILFPQVEHWYSGRYGNAIHGSPEKFFPGITCIFDHPFEVRIPLRLFWPGDESGTYRVTFPNDVFEGEEVVSFLVSPPNIRNMNGDEFSALEQDICSVVTTIRSIHVHLLSTNYIDGNARAIASTVMAHLEKATKDILSANQSESQVAIWEMHLAVEKSMKVFLSQASEPPPKIHNLKKLSDRTKNHGFEIEASLLEQMPESQQAINSRYANGRPYSIGSILSSYNATLEIVAECTEKFPGKQPFHNVIFTMREAMWK